MTKPSDLERVDILDRLICAECVATSREQFMPGNYYCKHTRVFFNVSKPEHHRKISMLVDVAPDGLGLVLFENYGNDGVLAIVAGGAHLNA